MLTNRILFFLNQAQTSEIPLAIEVASAKGIYLYTPEGTRYTDLISGVSVSNTGHSNPVIIQAVKDQAEKYMHVMVYGELIQSPQALFSHTLAAILPESLNSVYLVNSGSEAIDGAIKLSRRFTNRSEIISFTNAYHGGTLGAVSIMGGERWKMPYYPLLPDVRQFNFNDFKELVQITNRTSCVVMEPVQAEAGVILPEPGFLQAVRKRCTETGALLVFDEIQTGFGRTGSMFAFEKYQVTPDILVLAKAMGGGMPAGAFIASREIMRSLSSQPELGHITTFGGHPVCAAAALAHLQYLREHHELIYEAEKKGNRFVRYLQDHPKVKEIRKSGLLLSVDVFEENIQENLIRRLLQQGIISDGFLFRPSSFRISPPLTISYDEIEETCLKIIKALES